ncbi:methyltransferase [Algibacter miyuki]|uniref:Methyltransferase n=1 Tax=Algibacter miyuki TaxID=1306933 RepID=A0ABV5GX25_9FLAO|nr:methyltransferase [Algibacter miyuki]MDN3664279.1 methyltransferase [Algibacter miyuki]
MLKKVKKIIFPIAKLAFNTFHLKQRKYTYSGIEVSISSEVFPPHFTISTKILLDFIKPLNLTNQSFLELGCGSGIISLFAASKGAQVTASDINLIAIEALKKASIKNKIPVDVVYSDLFKNINKQHFDYIIINPPYYPKQPKNDKERAWFCGENFEYFQNLFEELETQSVTNTWMILSEDCKLNTIKQLALNKGFLFELLLEKTVYKEKNYIFSVQKKAIN